MGSAGIDVYFEPELAEGLHEIRGTITNEFQKTTRFQRVFAVSNSLCAGFAVISRIVHSMGVSSSSSSSSGVSFKSLSHVELGELESSSVTAGFALEYPTSSGVSLVMKTDWSSLMLYLNPLICLIILLFFWGFHRLALWLLQRQAAVHLADSPVFASSAFFASDRKLKLALLEKALSGAPWAVRWALSRVLLVCSDEWIAFGAIASLLCRCFLPRFYRDEKVGEEGGSEPREICACSWCRGLAIFARGSFGGIWTVMCLERRSTTRCWFCSWCICSSSPRPRRPNRCPSRWRVICC